MERPGQIEQQSIGQLPKATGRPRRTRTHGVPFGRVRRTPQHACSGLPSPWMSGQRCRRIVQGAHAERRTQNQIEINKEIRLTRWALAES